MFQMNNTHHGRVCDDIIQDTGDIYPQEYAILGK